MEIGYCVGPSVRYILLKGDSIEEEKQLVYWATLGLQSEFKLIDNLVSTFSGWYLFI